MTHLFIHKTTYCQCIDVRNHRPSQSVIANEVNVSERLKFPGNFTKRVEEMPLANYGLLVYR